MENEDYTSLEAMALKNPILSQLGNNDQHQKRILRLYQKNPAKDKYQIKCKVRAENFIPSEVETELSVFWSNYDIPDLSIPGMQENCFDFNAYDDVSSKEDLKATLLEEIPLGSNPMVVLSFFAKNNIPDVLGDKIGYGINNRLNSDNAIVFVSKMRSSYHTRMVNFLFNENKGLEDITIEFFSGTFTN